MMIGLGIVLDNARLGGFFSRGDPPVPGYGKPGGGGGRAPARALRALGLPPSQRAGAARRRAQAARHRAHHGGEAARAAARRAHQRRFRRGEVRHHADGARRGARRRRDGAVRRARHGGREPLRAARAGVLRRPHHRRRAARGGAAGPGSETPRGGARSVLEHREISTSRSRPCTSCAASRSSCRRAR